MSAGSTTKVTTLDLQILSFDVRRMSGYNEALLTLDDNSINATVILERSKDGSSFSEMGAMEYLPQGGVGKTYRLNDYAPFAGDNYYRAKYKNASGAFLYSRTVKLSGDKKGGFSILNNPVTDGRLKIKNTAAADGTYQLSIFDAAGKQVLSSAAAMQDLVTTIDVRKLSRGTYVLRVSSANGSDEMIRFIIE